MATTSTNLSLRKPATTDVVSVALDISANFQTLDDKWASSAAANIGAAAAAGTALTVARTDHVHAVGSGSAGAPGLPVGEATSGLYRIGSGQLGVSIAAALLATFKAAGVVCEAAFFGKQIATPAAPAAGYLALYGKSDANWYKQTPAGDEVLMLDTDLFTAAGDTLYFSADETPARLAAGTARQALTMNAAATAPAWAASLQSILTTTGDIIAATSANTPARLAVGAVSTLLSSDGTNPSWSASPTVSGTFTATTALKSGGGVFPSGQATVFSSAPVVAAAPTQGNSTLIGTNARMGVVIAINATNGTVAVFSLRGGANATTLLAGDSTVWGISPANDSHIHCIYSSTNYFLYNGFAAAQTLYAWFIGI